MNKKIICLLIILMLFVILIKAVNNTIDTSSSVNATIFKNETVNNSLQVKQVFTSSEIPNNILEKMIGKSIPSKNKVNINQLYNPYVVGNSVFPAEGKKYEDRSIVRKGTITKGDDLYNAFIKRGWSWGGNWKSKKDYQHFEKSN